MIATLIESEIMCDGHYVAREDTLYGIRLACKDGSCATVRHWQDPIAGADMWALDVWDTSGVLSVSANSRKAAQSIAIESDGDGTMIYELLDLALTALRYGWWTYTVVVWDAVNGCLKLVHREEAEEYTAVALNILSVSGRRYDDGGIR